MATLFKTIFEEPNKKFLYKAEITSEQASIMESYLKQEISSPNFLETLNFELIEEGTLDNDLESYRKINYLIV
tara:strand:+ start:301 stop:519 length:219 start_codon:yes stop_codon:yes gene_type:complete